MTITAGTSPSRKISFAGLHQLILPVLYCLARLPTEQLESYRCGRDDAGVPIGQ